jgi:hypothetical protein
LRHIAIAKDLRHEARADNFSRVHRNYSHAPILMPKKMMAPLNSQRTKSGYCERTNYLFSGQSREAAHEAILIV